MIAVFAHQHRRHPFADFHQVGHVGDVVLGQQVVHQPDAFQPRACAQRIAHLGRLDPGHLCQQGVGFRRVVHLEFHQQVAQLALVAGQGAVQQQGLFAWVELQQVGQNVDVAFQQVGPLGQRLVKPASGGDQHGHHVLGRFAGVFVQVKEQGAFFKRALPGAVNIQKLAGTELGLPLPGFMIAATLLEELPQPRQHRGRPDQMPADQGEQGRQIAPKLESWPQAVNDLQHKARAHQVQQRGVVQAGWQTQRAAAPTTKPAVGVEALGLALRRLVGTVERHDRLGRWSTLAHHRPFGSGWG